MREDLESAALRRLGELHVFLEGHEAPQLLQNCLDCVVSLPPSKDRDLPVVHLEKEIRNIPDEYNI